jgi:hypothetical protein
MPNTTETLKQLVETFAVEAEKFYSGNNAAGSRARKALQEIGKYAKTERKTIQEEKNARKAAKTVSPAGA